MIEIDFCACVSCELWKSSECDIYHELINNIIEPSQL